jgi:endonuclease/exonuclease/phosphatase family metal-dependent hydrolase
VAYNNIQGKFGKKGKKTVEEIQQMAEKHSWDIILLTETHRREGAHHINIPGYQAYSTERSSDQKKGGGNNSIY